MFVTHVNNVFSDHVCARSLLSHSRQLRTLQYKFHADWFCVGLESWMPRSPEEHKDLGRVELVGLDIVLYFTMSLADSLTPCLWLNC